VAKARTQFVDQSTRTIETLVLFLIAFFLVRPLFPKTGYLLAVVLPLGYLKLTVGKPDGFLLHLIYSWGVPIPGLLPPKLRRLRR
jgi:hypothetical protein